MIRSGGMRRGRGFLLACLAAVVFLQVTGTAARADDPAAPASGRLAGWLLVAAPHMPDPRFAGTVIFMLRHDARGAMGLIVNRLIAVAPATEILERIFGTDQPGGPGRAVRIQYGGPVETWRGFFLHSSDYTGEGTAAVTDRVSLADVRGVLRTLAEGKGPARSFLALGYAGWAPGQLEDEIRRRDWITVVPDDDLVCDEDMRTKWQRAMDKRGAEL